MMEIKGKEKCKTGSPTTGAINQFVDLFLSPIVDTAILRIMSSHYTDVVQDRNAHLQRHWQLSPIFLSYPVCTVTKSSNMYKRFSTYNFLKNLKVHKSSDIHMTLVFIFEQYCNRNYRENYNDGNYWRQSF